MHKSFSRALNTASSSSADTLVIKLDEDYLDDYLQSVIDSTPQQLLHRLSGLDDDNKSTLYNNTQFGDGSGGSTLSTPINPPFNGRHTIWQFFDCSTPDSGLYYCRVHPACTSSYTWPPSTTVAGRHLRDRHPDVYNYVKKMEGNRRMGLEHIAPSSPPKAFVARKRSFPSKIQFNSQQRQYNSAAPGIPLPRAFVPHSSHNEGVKGIVKTEEISPRAIKTEEIFSLDDVQMGANNQPLAWKRSKLSRIELNAKQEEPTTNGASSSWEENEKTIELKTNIARLREQEMALKVKHQKTAEQLQDIKAEVEDLRSRNEQLEKRQKNFNNELKSVRDQSDEILLQKEKLEKQCFDQNMATSRRNTEFMALKEENNELRSSLQRVRRDLETIEESNSGKSDGDLELSNLRKIKREQETKITELEDDLEEATQKNHQLEQNVTRLEMSVERARLEAQREAESKEGEIAEIRQSYQRRLRAFEDQLNDLSDANNSLVKQNRLLEARTRQLDSQNHASNSDLSCSNHYKRELRKALALWRDAQSLLTHERESAPSQSLLRQLKEQLEDSEAAKLSALKSRHTLENELADLRSQLEMTESLKTAAEEKVISIMREKNSAAALCQEQDEQLQELLKKYKAQVQQSHVDSITLADQTEQLGNLERVKQRLQEQLNQLNSEIEFNKLHMVEKHKFQLLEMRIRELQNKFDLEVAHKLRLESIVVKLREEVECLQEQLIEAKSTKEKELESSRRSKKETLLLQEQLNELKKRETELSHKLKATKTEKEKVIDEHQITTSDLKLAMKRIDVLQAALNADITAGSDIEEEDEDEMEHQASTSSFLDEDEGSVNNKNL